MALVETQTNNYSKHGNTSKYINSIRLLNLIGSIPRSLVLKESIYNTDHIFMSTEELEEFKRKLTFYKYDAKIDVKGKIKELKSAAPPII